jgi:tetratricopeptide (TPR) repeat protein
LTEPAGQGTGAGEVRSEIGRAQVTGDVVQARDVAGGVHFHAARTGSGGSPVVPRQLPADVSVFVNRARELRALTRLIAPATPTAAGAQAKPRTTAAVVVVITGSAGVGKTALALHWAHRIRDRFPDGELYANLHGYDDGAPVTAEVALDRFLRDLGVSPQAVPADLDGRSSLFRSLIAGRRVLIVLDNVADIGQVRPLIPGGAGPLLVITSRNELTGLAVRDGARHIRLDIFQESDAVTLVRLVTRSGGRRDAPADLAELAQLCARLPLALRVAAEHAVSRPTMRLAELIADLRDDSLLWDALSVGDGPHGEAVRTVFAWSYRDLPDESARLFRALGLHQGPDISLAAAAAAVGVPARTARRSLDILLGAFLIQTVRPHRYQLHDLLRAYALDQARAVDTAAARQETVDRIAGWYAAAAASACRVLYPGSRLPVDPSAPDGAEPMVFKDAAAAADWVDTERPNLVANARAALDAGLRRRAWELAMALSPIHANTFAFDDWSALSAVALAAAEELSDPAALAAALANRGDFLFRRRRHDDAKAAQARALPMWRELGDDRGTLIALNALGWICMAARELPEATDYFTQAAALTGPIGDALWAGMVTANLAQTQMEAGDIALALRTLAPLPGAFAGLRSPGQQGNALLLQGRAHRLEGNLPAAREAMDSALRLAEEAGNRMWEAWWLIEAARVHLAAGDTGEAMRCCQLAASLQRQIGDHSREATALDCAGEIMLADGNAADAAAFHREAARMHQQLGDRWQQALATLHLADCDQALGQADDLRDDLTAALALLQPFPDDRAARLRAQIRERLA